jgi:glycosyltransferase involved in cell wall biosynthesis
MNNRLIQVIVPVYNEESNLEEFVNRLKKVFDKTNKDLEIIFCVDPSTDKTELILSELCQKFKFIKIIKFTRNVGQATATLAGIQSSSADAIIVMDADLQDPPEVIAYMLDKWEEGYKVVLGQRVSRKTDPIFKRLIAKTGYAFLNKFAEVPIPRDTGDFRLLDAKVVGEIKKFDERNNFLRGIVSYIGYDEAVIKFDRPPRFSGKTHYNKWFGSIKIALNGILGFSTAFLSLAVVIGLFVSLFALLTGFSYLVFKIMGYPFPIGNPTIVILILFLGGINLLFGGITGLYIGRIYSEVKKRPQYFIKETSGFESNN